MDELFVRMRQIQDAEFREDDDLYEEEYSEDEALVGLFKGKPKPDYRVSWEMYQKGLAFNTQINLDETVKVNENFFVGRVA